MTTMLRHFKAVSALFCGIFILSSCGPYEGSRYSAYYESDDYYAGYSNGGGPFYPGYSWYQFGISWTSPLFYSGYHDHWYNSRRYSYRYAPPPPPRPYHMRPRPYGDRYNGRDHARYRHERDGRPSGHDNGRRPRDGSQNHDRPAARPSSNENGTNKHRPQRPENAQNVNKPQRPERPDDDQAVHRPQRPHRPDSAQANRPSPGSDQASDRYRNREAGRNHDREARPRQKQRPDEYRGERQRPAQFDDKPRRGAQRRGS